MKNLSARRAYTALAVVLGTFSTVALAATFNLFSPATGILKGNASTYVTTAATSADVVATFSGTCTGTNYLAANGTCIAVAAAPTGANPTASVGLTAVNGAASTFMRSDAAPVLSQAIAPTWTAVHTFANAGNSALLSSTDPLLFWNETDAAVDNRRWGVRAAGESLLFQSWNDAASTSASFLTVDRTGTTIDAVNFPSVANFNGPSVNIENSASAVLRMIDSAAATDEKRYRLRSQLGQFQIVAENDAGAASSTPVLINRTGTTIDSIAFTATAVSVNGSNVCTANGTNCPGGASAANPTASVGLTAVNGAAATYMRSDAAPALSQAIAPTWSGTHIFAGGIAQVIRGVGAPADTSNTIIDVNSTNGTFTIASATDAAPTTGLTTAFLGLRSGTAWSGLQFGNSTDNPTYTFNGTGAISGNGSGLTSLNAGNVSSGTLAVARGGTGVGTLTGIAKGNGTSAFTAAASSDVIATWTGTCNSTTFLRADGSCQAAGGASLSGNNTWTGSNNFTGGLTNGGNAVLTVSSSFASGTIFANGSGCSVSNPVGMSSSCTRNGLGSYTVAFTTGISASKCTAALSGTTVPSIIVFGFNNTFSNLNVGAQNSGGAVDPAQFHVICTI